MTTRLPVSHERHLIRITVPEGHPMHTIQTATVTTVPARPDRRTIERNYLLADLATTGRYGDAITPQLTVSVHHDKERKSYVFIVDRSVRTPFGFRTVIHVGRGLPDEVRALWFREATARYSAKDLQQRFDEYIRDHIEPNLPALLEYAAGALAENLD